MCIFIHLIHISCFKICIACDDSWESWRPGFVIRVAFRLPHINLFNILCLYQRHIENHKLSRTTLEQASHFSVYKHLKRLTDEVNLVTCSCPYCCLFWPLEFLGFIIFYICLVILDYDISISISFHLDASPRNFTLRLISDDMANYVLEKCKLHTHPFLCVVFLSM